MEKRATTEVACISLNRSTCKASPGCNETTAVRLSGSNLYCESDNSRHGTSCFNSEAVLITRNVGIRLNKRIGWLLELIPNLSSMSDALTTTKSVEYEQPVNIKTKADKPIRNKGLVLTRLFILFNKLPQVNFHHLFDTCINNLVFRACSWSSQNRTGSSGRRFEANENSPKLISSPSIS